METLETVESLRGYLNSEMKAGRTVGFVPTMGALHDGHLSLIELAKDRCDCIVASIFVNPTQFNDSSDLDAYPRPIEVDREKLRDCGVTCLFAPAAKEIYSDGFSTWVEVTGLTDEFEGVFRPGHFRGVATVVTILLAIVQPSIAVFGEKDFQQLRVIEQLVSDLKLPVEIVRAATKRETNGLAMSSRNERLSRAGREEASALYAGLCRAVEAYAEGEHNPAGLVEVARRVISKQASVRIEYLDVVEQQSFKRPTIASADCRVITAAYVEGVRLIDNVALA